MKKIVLSVLSYVSMAFLLMAGLVSCQESPKNQLLLFLEGEEGVDPYSTRIVITPDYMRFDEGEQSKTFLLIDRKQQIAYSVDHDQKTIMRVDKQAVALEAPIELNYTVTELDDFKDAPEINGSKPRHRQLLTNDQVCLDVVSVAGLMPEAVVALKEYHQILAADSAVTFNIMPADMHEPCAISMSTFAPTRHLEYGLPVQEWKEGYARSLEEYDDNYKTDPKLFMLPENYFSYSVQEFREGRADIANRKVLPLVQPDAQPDSSEAPADAAAEPKVDSAN